MEHKITPKHALANMVKVKINEYHLSDDSFISPELSTNNVGETTIALNPSIITGSYRVSSFMSQMN